MEEMTNNKSYLTLVNPSLQNLHPHRPFMARVAHPWSKQNKQTQTNTALVSEEQTQSAWKATCN